MEAGLMIASTVGSNVLGKAYEVGSKMYPSIAAGQTFQGSVENSSNLYKIRQMGVYCYDTQVRADEARRLDEFFTRFGYAQNRVMKPNPAARPCFTFLQTADDTYVNGSYGRANSAEQKKINEILKHGVTFWRSSVSSGDLFKYNTLNNQPT